MYDQCNKKYIQTLRFKLNLHQKIAHPKAPTPKTVNEWTYCYKLTLLLLVSPINNGDDKLYFNKPFTAINNLT